MMFHQKRFNIYLLVGIAAIIAFGCQSAEKKKKKALARLELHIEATQGETGRTEVASIFRDNPFDVTVEKTAFLTDGNVAEAKVINAMGGFAISIQMNREGTWLLEQYTAGNIGRKIGVYSQFGTNLTQHRWLAAPVISKRIPNGLFVFTPDTSRDEADEIVLGLNNVAKKMGGNWMHEQ